MNLPTPLPSPEIQGQTMRGGGVCYGYYLFVCWLFIFILHSFLVEAKLLYESLCLFVRQLDRNIIGKI